MDNLVQKNKLSPFPGWGKVASVDGDTVTLEGGLQAVKCCDCRGNDIVALEYVRGTLRAIAIKGGDSSRKTGNTVLRAGLILPYASNKIPEGFLPCDGAAVSRSQYSLLFAAIGTTWGAGDGSTTFNVPNLNGRTLIGKDGSYALGATGGESSHTLSVSEMPKHDHIAFINGTDSTGIEGDSGTNGWLTYGSTPKTANESNYNKIMGAQSGAGWISAQGRMRTGTRGMSGAHNNMQPYAAANYIICTGESELGAHEYLPLDGGTVNGTVNFLETPTVQGVVNARYCTKNNAADYAATDTVTRYSGVFFDDKNDNHFGYIQASRRTDGASWLEISARSATDGTSRDNPLRLILNSDGTRETYLHAPSWQSAIKELGTSIASGTDFDMLTTPGVYYTSSSSVSTACPNCPIKDQGAILEVDRAISTNSVTQTVRGWADGKTYTRGISSTKTYPWIMTGGITSVVSSSSTDVAWGDWNWVKWADGQAMCWKYVQFNSAIQGAWGNLYVSGAVAAQAYPFTFVNTPGFTAMPVNWNNNYTCWPIYNYSGTKSATPPFQLARPSAVSTSSTFNFVVFAWGRWK